jgi:hypothetical protein
VVAGRGLTHRDSWVTEQGLPARPIQQLWQAPVFSERTSVGLDVHARSVVAAAIDGVTGELVQARLTPSAEHIRSWVQALPGPVAVSYEAGPTGFDLSRLAQISHDSMLRSAVARPAGCAGPCKAP